LFGLVIVDLVAGRACPYPLTQGLACGRMVTAVNAQSAAQRLDGRNSVANVKGVSGCGRWGIIGRTLFFLNSGRPMNIAQLCVSFLVGIAGSLIGAFLTPRIQHRFWIRQKRFDLRTTTLNELHSLSTKLFEYLGPDWATGELTGAHQHERDVEFEDAFARDWHAVVDRIKFLFAPEACQELAALNAKLPRVLFRQLPDPPEKAYDIWDDFIRSRELAFEALYKDLFV